jgi:hypothetical protein
MERLAGVKCAPVNMAQRRVYVWKRAQQLVQPQLRHKRYQQYDVAHETAMYLLVSVLCLFQLAASNVKHVAPGVVPRLETMRRRVAAEDAYTTVVS